jgi:hypothetical protein
MFAHPLIDSGHLRFHGRLDALEASRRRDDAMYMRLRVLHYCALSRKEQARLERADAAATGVARTPPTASTGVLGRRGWGDPPMHAGRALAPDLSDSWRWTRRERVHSGARERHRARTARRTACPPGVSAEEPERAKEGLEDGLAVRLGREARRDGLGQLNLWRGARGRRTQSLCAMPPDASESATARS